MFAHQFMNNPELKDLKPGMLSQAVDDEPDLRDDRPGNYL